MITVGDRQIVTSARAASPAPVALYVHVPFCLSICPYCDFVVYSGRAARGAANLFVPYVDAVVAEIGLRAHPGARLASVYLGGGTPSLLGVAQVARILRAVDDAFSIASDAEITIEANPGRDERGDLAGFRAAGVNRLSIGAQSLQGGDLRRLGRRHAAADVAETVKLARSSGLDNCSVDLLYDVPGQTVDSWRETLEGVVGLGVDHVSAYALSLDDPDAEGLTGPNGDHLPLRPGARQWRRRARTEQSEDRAAEMYSVGEEVLSQAGFEWYELSNWARQGRESRHNLAYWQGRPWEAVGPGAHAFDGARTRRWNAARLDGYLDALLPSDGHPPRVPPGDQAMTDEQTATSEEAILRLRTRAGLPSEMAAHFPEALAWARANGLVEPTAGDGVRLTLPGRLLSNELFVRLLPQVIEMVA